VEQLASGLTDLGAEVYPPPEMRHHILTFTHPKAESNQLLSQLTERDFVISCRRGRIRVSPHLYNTSDEIEKLLTAVEECLGAS
jgi:selenocysteine lyase/cysteine desulfurase